MEKENYNSDLLCFDFNQNLVKLINESNLPISVIELILKDVLNEVVQTKRNVLNQAIQTRKKEQQEEDKKND